MNKIWRDYLVLCKPRVVALMTLTAIVGMCLAAPAGKVPWQVLILGSLGITLTACSGGVVNQLIDRHIDALMARTKQRPIAAGRIQPLHAWVWAAFLLMTGMIVLLAFVNPLVALLSFLAMVGYAGVYTLYLKRATPQNIVIGGLAGAMPPLLGWTAVTGQIQIPGLLLVLIIFTWTPPHFWALAIHRYADYVKVNIPMLPVTHGIPYTRLSILLYTVFMIVSTYLPFIFHVAGVFYLLGVTVLNALFFYYVWGLYRNKSPRYPWATFRYSIIYLMLLFICLLIDHVIL